MSGQDQLRCIKYKQEVSCLGVGAALPVTSIRACLSTDDAKAEDGRGEYGLRNMHYNVTAGYERGLAV